MQVCSMVRSQGTYIIVIQASEQADIVDHGDARGEELNGPGQQVVPGVAP